MPELLASGKLREAKAAAMSLPADSGLRAEAMRDVEDAQRRLDLLTAAGGAALAGTDVARAAALLTAAALIRAEDAAAELATVPLPPPADLRATGDGIAVQLFWRPAKSHDADTVYAVRRTAQPRPLIAPSEGEPVHRDCGDTCTDDRVPVARPVQYAVFAVGDGRPELTPGNRLSHAAAAGVRPAG